MNDLERIFRHQFVGLDTETTGLHISLDAAFLVTLYTPNEQAILDLRDNFKLGQRLANAIKLYDGTLISHNASFDWQMLLNADVWTDIEKYDDTVIRACIINEHLPSYDLDSLSRRYLGEGKDTDLYLKLAEIFGGPATRNVQMKNIHRAPLDAIAGYALTDAKRAYDLYMVQQGIIEKQDLESIARFERQLLPVVARTERHGIRVDVHKAEQAANQLTPLIDEAQTKLNQLIGSELNVNSSPQIKKLFDPQPVEVNGITFWQANDGTMCKTTKNGNASIDAEVLREMTHPAAALIQEVRSLIKTRDTFLRGHVIGHAVSLGNQYRVYPTINQTKGMRGGTGTGRFSYQDPAMQQIPSRNKRVAKIVKPCFLADLDHVWVDSDMRSFEVNVFAELVDDPQINARFAADPLTDFHQFVADLTNLNRNATYSGEPNAKQLNLSMIFNSGNGAIAAKMGMDWTWQSFTDRQGKPVVYRKAGPEAEAVIARYHAELPGVKELALKMQKMAELYGHIVNYKGRRIRFPNGFKSYKASGLLIQSTAAELNKENWLIITQALGNNGRLVLNTHDAYSMCIMPDWRPIYKEVKREIENPRTRIPLILELKGHGYDWWDAVRGDE